MVNSPVKCYLCYLLNLLNFGYEQQKIGGCLRIGSINIHAKTSEHLDRLLKRKTKTVATLAIQEDHILLRSSLSKLPTSFRRGIHCARAQNRRINWPNILPNGLPYRQLGYWSLQWAECAFFGYWYSQIMGLIFGSNLVFSTFGTLQFETFKKLSWKLTEPPPALVIPQTLTSGICF